MTVDGRAEAKPLTCADVDELSGAFALSALPDDEAQQVIAHCTYR